MLRISWASPGLRPHIESPVFKRFGVYDQQKFPKFLGFLHGIDLMLSNEEFLNSKEHETELSFT